MLAIDPVRSFARTWLVELKERRIRVNILRRGTIDTPILDRLGPEAKEFFKSQIPRGEMGRPEKIATVALFLASSDSSFVNGVELFVDGDTVQIQPEESVLPALGAVTTSLGFSFLTSPDVRIGGLHVACIDLARSADDAPSSDSP